MVDRVPPDFGNGLGNLALLAISNVVKKQEVWLLSWLIVMPRQKERWKRRRKAGWYLLQKLSTCLEIIACDNCQWWLQGWLCIKLRQKYEDGWESKLVAMQRSGLLCVHGCCVAVRCCMLHKLNAFCWYMQFVVCCMVHGCCLVVCREIWRVTSSAEKSSDTPLLSRIQHFYLSNIT